MENKICDTCRYYILRSSGEWGCWNIKSEYFGDNPKPEHTCLEWKGDEDD